MIDNNRRDFKYNLLLSFELTVNSAKLHIVTIYSGYKNDRKDIQTIATWQ